MHRLLFFFFLLFAISACENKDKEKHPVIKVEKREIDTVTALQERISSVISHAKPSIVTILSKSSEGKTPTIFKFNDEIPPGENESLGSGFVIRKSGNSLFIVTNSHVIEKAKVIIVKFYNGNRYEAEVVGKDTKSDIAVLKVKVDENIKNVKPLKIGSPSTLKVGYFVVSGGSPYNLGLTFTLGIVSALNRNLGISAYENYIQTDAAINPGDSGGPLLNLNGEVVGMNTAIIQTGQGLGFAIPINTVVDIANQLIKYGRVRRGWLGVLVQKIPEKLKKELGLSSGVQIIKVFKNSPAAISGLKTGDIILSIKGKKISSPSDLKYIVSQLKPEETVEVEYIRGRKKYKIVIKIKELVDRK
ncbi:trypsin-like serine protease [Persephonella atlantica]|uniref:Trypsin-like serine protease n=1 Tax=Persephonella atlantica TaxID=2699429 RepID=A0ABS1GK65_9AQUI|nr:trypsin-like peptidase domain-containing protein [Persephonella atlantica]MBK3333328.1 trypsin-like serine protease [Persephonella atlantica]